MQGFSDSLPLEGSRIADIILCKNQISFEYIFHLESPNIHYQITEFGESIFFCGWIICKKQPVKFIRFSTSEKIIEKIKVDCLRPDVSQAYPDFHNTESCGFSDRIKINELPHNGEVSLEAIFNDGTVVKLANIRIEKFLYKTAPDFIIIGAMKSATTSIYNYLQQHPRVIAREPKELHFFTYNIDKGYSWYLSHFAGDQNNHRRQKLLIGEASPSYLTDKTIPFAIKTKFSSVKIIASIRNSTDRAISHYYHQFNRIGDEKRNIEEAFSEAAIERVKAIQIEDLSNKEIKEKLKTGEIQGAECLLTLHYLLGGQYINYLKGWLNVFPREQILILNYNQLEREPQCFIERLFTFLDLQDYLDIEIHKIYENKYSEAPSLIKKRLDEYYQPYNQELDTFLKARCVDFYKSMS